MTQNYPQRKPLRLKGYDYSLPGSYFLTICTKDRRPILSRISGFDGGGLPEHTLSVWGKTVDACIKEIPAHYTGVVLEKYVVMPNHIHILLTLPDIEDGAPGSSRPTELIPKIVSALKRLTNRSAGIDLWQSSYMDHVIRDDADFQNHWNYIEHNPFRWAEDEYYL